MTRLLLAFLSWFGALFRSRHDLGLELVALRQQVGVLKRKNPRPQLSPWDRLFWLGLRRWWSKWARVLVVVKPETVVGWHRAGFRGYWRFLSPRRPGRPKIHGEGLTMVLEKGEPALAGVSRRGPLAPGSGRRWARRFPIPISRAPPSSQSHPIDDGRTIRQLLSQVI